MALRLSEVIPKSDFGEQLVKWLSCKYFGRGQKVEVVANDEDVFSINIYTAFQKYHITATSSAASSIEGGYLGCIVSSRRARPGETWHRGSDLPDGGFSKETLCCILCAIVFYEAREVVKDIPSSEVEERAG